MSRSLSVDPAVDRGSSRSKVAEILRGLGRLSSPAARLLAGHRWFSFWAIVRHRGRRSGRAYATPVVARRAGDGFVVPLPFGERTQWLHNVRADGRAALRWGGTEYAVAGPEVLDLKQAASAFRWLEVRLARLAGIDAFLRLRIEEPGEDRRALGGPGPEA